MSFQRLRAVRDSSLEANARLVLFVLVTYADKTGLAWPAVETLARGSDLAQSTVRGALKALAALGVVEYVGGRSGGRRSNRYRVHFDRIPRRPNPPAPGGFNPPAGGALPSVLRRPTHRDTEATPPPGGDEHSIQHARGTTNQGGLLFGWTEGSIRGPREALIASGVKGQKVGVLAKRFNLEQIRAACRTIRGRPGDVRDPGAVLVWFLETGQPPTADRRGRTAYGAN